MKACRGDGPCGRAEEHWKLSLDTQNRTHIVRAIVGREYGRWWDMYARTRSLTVRILRSMRATWPPAPVTSTSILPTPSSVIQHMNSLARIDGRSQQDSRFQHSQTPIPDDDSAAATDHADNIPSFNDVADIRGDDDSVPPHGGAADTADTETVPPHGEIGGAADTANTETVPPHGEIGGADTAYTETADTENNESEPTVPPHGNTDNELTVPPHSDTESTVTEHTAPTATEGSRGRRRLIDVFRHGQEAMVFKVSVRDAMRDRGDAAKDVILSELSQMITKRVWTPVHVAALSATDRNGIIRSSMFIKEKFTANGSFEKLKARLVAGGNMQDKTLYDDLSAPTVSTCAVFTLLSIAAAEQRHIAAIDIGGAFLHASMETGVNVHMRLDKTMTQLLLEIESSYAPFVDHKGGLVVRLDKALYGCVESAALWHDHLSQTLADMGYLPNSYDPCVYNRVEGGVQCTVAVHVDDLLVTSTSEGMISELSDGMRTKYGEVKCVRGPVIGYLGMVFDVSRTGEATVTMGGYIDDLMKTCAAGKGARTPALDDLFETDPDDALNSEEVRKEFHRNVARVLYLAKRARPDCLTAVAFLATRVQKCTAGDVRKLDRLMQYIRSTKDRGLVMRPGPGYTTVSIYIDAAYGVHSDGKSHTGSCVVLGDVGVVHCKSGKQGIVTKSSTEAELVALSDSCNQGIYVRRFLREQGYEVGPLRVLQDNMSCMALVKRGRSAAEKTRHIHIRYYWVKEQVSRGVAVIEHLRTELMYANVLTTPLQGGQFVRKRGMLTRWVDNEPTTN